MLYYFLIHYYFSPSIQYMDKLDYQLNSIQSLSRIQLFVTPCTEARQASLSITNSWSLLKLMSIE